MKANVGNVDRAVRAIVGIILIALPFVTGFAVESAALRWGAVLIGLVLVATAGLKFCPAYRVLGISTCQTSSAR